MVPIHFEVVMGLMKNIPRKKEKVAKKTTGISKTSVQLDMDKVAVGGQKVAFLMPDSSRDRPVLEFVSQTANVAHNTPVTNGYVVQVTVCAPTAREKGPRMPVDVVMVLDVSGSMQGDIELLKKVVRFMAGEMKSGDRLSVVTFSTEAEVIFGLTPMLDKKNLEWAMGKVSKIEVQSNTNIGLGLEQGLNILRNRSPGDIRPVSQLILLTDGNANEGITGMGGMAALVEGRMDSSGRSLSEGHAPSSFSIATFGFGTNHKEEMLKEIATHTNGQYCFVRSQDEIAAAFVNSVGGRMSVVMKDIEVRIQAQNGVQFIGCPETSYKWTRIPGNNNAFSVKIPDMQSEERRDILIRVRIPKGGDPLTSWNVLLARTKWTDVGKKEQKEQIYGAITRKDEPFSTTTNPKIQDQLNRLNTESAMKTAMQKTENDDYEAARFILKQAIDFITQNNSASGTVLSVAMVADLWKRIKDLRSRDAFAEAGGSKQMACDIGGFGSQRYSGRSRVSRSKSSGFITEMTQRSQVMI